MNIISWGKIGSEPIEYIKVSGGLFKDMMIHDFDMAVFLMGGMPASVMATGAVLTDPQIETLGDFDSATAVASIEKTHRALIVHEAVRFGGFGGEIVAQLQEEAFDYLDAPIARVGAPFSPVPYSPALEKVYIPNADNIVAEVKKVLGL